MKNKGQSTLEYALIVTVIMAAMVAINIYMKRGVQGKLRESADKIGEQYSAGKTTFKYTTTTEETLTRDTFGLADSVTDNAPNSATTDTARGVSRYVVKTPGQTTRSAAGTDAETINRRLDSEKLFE